MQSEPGLRVTASSRVWETTPVGGPPQPDYLNTAGLALKRLVLLVTPEEADAIERLWQKAWWALHYGGRGGPTVLAISAFDMRPGLACASRPVSAWALSSCWI